MPKFNAPRVTIILIYAVMAVLVVTFLLTTIKFYLATRPVQELISSTEGVEQWRYHVGFDLLGYKFEVDHVIKTPDSIKRIQEYNRVFSFELPSITYSEPSNTETGKRILADSKNINYATVDLVDAAVMIRIKDQSVQAEILVFVIIILAVALVFGLFWLWNFKKLISSLSLKDSQFDSDNIFRLRLLGALLLVGVVAHLIFELGINLYIFNNFTFLSSGSIDPNFEIQLMMIVFGLTLIILSGVIKHGIVIKEDQDLTI